MGYSFDDAGLRDDLLGPPVEGWEEGLSFSRLRGIMPFGLSYMMSWPVLAKLQFVHLVNSLDWRCKKGQSTLCFLRKLRHFVICSKMLHVLYKTVVESVISSIGVEPHVSDLKKLTNKAASALQAALEHLRTMENWRILHKMMDIMDMSNFFIRQLYNNVFSQRVFSFTVRQTATGEPSCPQSSAFTTLWLLHNLSYNI